ncbi:MAG: hypothetical protein ABSF00_02940 [Candidatus Bathyarchaeia archaeon]|jgi:hypothetical protein
MKVRLYRMTLSTGSLYDKGNREARSFEGHFKAYLRGKIRHNRKRLTDFAIPRFQTQVRRELGIRISRARSRVGIEREEPALSSSKRVDAEFLVITYRGKKHVARKLPPRTFKLGRARRAAPKTRKRRRVKHRKEPHQPKASVKGRSQRE